MLLIDLEEGRIISDEEVKTEIANEFPYQKWLEEELVQVNPDPEIREEEQFDDLLVRQKAFGYTYEDIQKYLIPVIKEGKGRSALWEMIRRSPFYPIAPNHCFITLNSCLRKSQTRRLTRSASSL